MNAKRQLSGLNRRDFTNKKATENIKYLRKKYELLGYAVPNYLQGKVLTKSQLNQAINKITTGLNSAIKKQTQTKKRQSNPTGINFTKIKKAEAQFLNSFKYSSELEKEVFINNKTVQFLDGHSIGSPLQFHNFNNKQEFDNFIKTIAPENRKQYLEDYLNSLKANNYKEIKSRLLDSFTQKKESFYDVNRLSSRELGNEVSFTDKFKLLDYVRRMDMMETMDSKEYEQMVESLVKKGYSEPLAMNIALDNLGFRPDSDYAILD